MNPTARTRNVQTTHQLTYAPEDSASAGVLDRGNEFEPLACQRLAHHGDVIVWVLELAYRCIVIPIADQQGNAFLRDRSRMGQQKGH